MIKEIIQGASVSWTVNLSAYPPSDGWLLKYYIRGVGTGLNLTVQSNNDEFVVKIESSETAALAVGEYAYQAFVERNTEKICVDEGTIRVKQGFSVMNPSEVVDPRSEIKKILDAIDACIKKKATSDQLSYTIGNRQLSRYSISDLILLRDKYQKLYNQEIRVEKLKKGTGGIFKNVFYRFKNPR